MSPIPERISEAFLRATGHHESTENPETSRRSGDHPERPFSIAISREAGTRGPAVGQAVGARLGWKVYDQELLEIVARELHVRVKLLENLDDRHVTWLQESIESFAAVPAVREGKYVRQLIETMLSLAATGQCVIVGRGSQFVLPPATTLRVRLVAPVEFRIANVSHDQNLARHEAAKFIEQTDRARMQFVRLHFLRDSTDPRYYDLFLNAAQFTADECADLVIAALQKKSHGAAVPASFNPEMALTSG
jgi:cytidylate kinase